MEKGFGSCMCVIHQCKHASGGQVNLSDLVAAGFAGLVFCLVGFSKRCLPHSKSSMRVHKIRMAAFSGIITNTYTQV